MLNLIKKIYARSKAKVVDQRLPGKKTRTNRISDQVAERGTEKTDGRMGSGSDEKGLGGPLPDPWFN